MFLLPLYFAHPCRAVITDCRQSKTKVQDRPFTGITLIESVLRASWFLRSNVKKHKQTKRLSQKLIFFSISGRKANEEGIRKEIDVRFIKNPLTTKSLGSPINTDPRVQQHDRGKSQRDGTALKRATQ